MELDHSARKYNLKYNHGLELVKGQGQKIFALHDK